MSEGKQIDTFIFDVFEKYDKDGNGVLNFEEKKKFTEYVMTEMDLIDKGEHIDDETYTSIYKNMDTDNDGQIQQKEFKDFLLFCIENTE